jgi:hypothetical protein
VKRPPATSPGRFAYGRFLLNLLLAIVPVALLWVALTPLLDQVLRAGGGALVQLTEVPNVTELLPAAADPHYAVIHRRDFPPARANVTSFRITDVHFHWVLLGVLFLAVPGVPWQRRLLRLGQATLVLLAFDVVLVMLWVKFTYATQLGAWSAEHYGPFAQNAWGLAKHVADLPIKLALPFALWAGFYLGLLLPRRDAAGER